MFVHRRIGRQSNCKYNSFSSVCEIIATNGIAPFGRGYAELSPRKTSARHRIWYVIRRRVVG